MATRHAGRKLVEAPSNESMRNETPSHESSEVFVGDVRQGRKRIWPAATLMKEELLSGDDDDFSHPLESAKKPRRGASAGRSNVRYVGEDEEAEHHGHTKSVQQLSTEEIDQILESRKAKARDRSKSRSPRRLKDRHGQPPLRIRRKSSGCTGGRMSSPAAVVPHAHVPEHSSRSKIGRPSSRNWCLHRDGRYAHREYQPVPSSIGTLHHHQCK